MTSFAKVCIDLSNNLRNFRFNKSTGSATLNEGFHHKQAPTRPDPLSSVDIVNPCANRTFHSGLELNGNRPSSLHHNGVNVRENGIKTESNSIVHEANSKKEAPPIPKKMIFHHPITNKTDDSNHVITVNKIRAKLDDSRCVSKSPKINRKLYSSLNSFDQTHNTWSLKQETGCLPRSDHVVISNRSTFSPTIAHRIATLTRTNQYNYCGSETYGNEEHTTYRNGTLSNGGSPLFPHRGTSVAAIKQRLLNQGLKIDLQTARRSPNRTTTRYRDHVRRLVRGRGLILSSLWKEDRLLKLIFTTLSGNELLSACLVCKHWYHVIVTQGFWDRVTIKLDMRQLSRDIFNINHTGSPSENQTLNEIHCTEQNLEKELKERLQCGMRRRIRSLSINHLTNRHSLHLYNSMATVLHNGLQHDGVMHNSTPSSSRNSNMSFNSPILSSRHPLLPIQSFNSLTQTSTHANNCKSETPITTSISHSELSTFTQLKLHCCSISDEDLERIVHLLAGIRSLELHCCNQISELAFWVCLEPTIEQLNISDCINVSDESVGAVVQLLPSLNEFSLQAYHVSDMALTYFSPEQRENLRVARFIQCMDLTNQGVTNLAFALPHLNELSLSGCTSVGDDGVAVICDQLKQLIKLDLSWCSKITDRGLESMTTELPLMRKLTLDRCIAITDIGIGHLSTMSGLRHLNLRWCVNLSDGTIPHLLCMTGLTDLSLTGCKRIAEDGMCQLARHPRLRRLELMHCPGASLRVKDYLITNLSGCRLQD